MKDGRVLWPDRSVDLRQAIYEHMQDLARAAGLPDHGVHLAPDPELNRRWRAELLERLQFAVDQRFARFVKDVGARAGDAGLVEAAESALSRIPRA